MICRITDRPLGACTDGLLLEILNAVHSDEDYRQPDMGICAGVDRYCEDHNWIFDSMDGLELRHLMSLWPKFSGRTFHPVPSTDPDRDSRDMYMDCDDCWNKDTEYGQLRWELLEFCIQRLEDRIYEDGVS